MTADPFRPLQVCCSSLVAADVATGAGAFTEQGFAVYHRRPDGTIAFEPQARAHSLGAFAQRIRSAHSLSARGQRSRHARALAAPRCHSRAHGQDSPVVRFESAEEDEHGIHTACMVKPTYGHALV